MSKTPLIRNWHEVAPGGAILEAGNSEEYNTGAWRTFRPIHDAEKCTNCLRCWILCPDGSIQVEDGKVVGINYFHCKGCGICAAECPPKIQAIAMELDTKES